MKYNISDVIIELYKVFEILNREYFDNSLDEPIITVQEEKPNILGYFITEPLWYNRGTNEKYYEINLNPIGFNKDSDEIIGVLLHEMCHYYNRINNINDGKGNRHNKKFKESAERVGLVVDEDNFAITTTSDELKHFIHSNIEPFVDVNVFDLYLTIELKEKERKPRKKTQFKYICPKCGMVAKAKAELNIVCGACQIELEMEDVEENEDSE